MFYLIQVDTVKGAEIIIAKEQAEEYSLAISSYSTPARIWTVYGKPVVINWTLGPVKTLPEAESLAHALADKYKWAVHLCVYPIKSY